ncbi:MAG: DNA internalization-related competence protein ComEC/Rec2 [Firmicutes bacterium]|nr:DNA internalization-related competence protein ComEC/Rec2 [Bacillota bacterium]
MKKMRKPSSSLLFFPFLALGIYLGSLSFLDLKSALIILVGLTIVWLVLAYQGKSWGENPWIYRLILALGAVVVGQIAVIPQQAWVIPQKGEFTGQIYEVRPLSYDQRLLVRLRRSRLQVAVHIPSDLSVQVGDELTFSGTITLPKKAPNPGVFCYRSYLRSLGVFGVCYPDEYEITHIPRQSLLERVRGWLRHNIVETLRDPGLVLALVLGEREQLGTARQEVWRELGISHLLAISGMHVGFVALAVGLLVRRLPVRPLVRLLLVQSTLLVYIILSGTGASGWRALLVSMLGGYAGFIGSRQDPLHIWATAGWLLLLAKPNLVFDLGFTLSFAASGGILLWRPSIKLNCQNRVLNYLANSLLISTIAQLSLAPFLLHYFGEMAIIGPVATLVFVPLVVVLLVGGFLVALGSGSFGVGYLLNLIMTLVDVLESFLKPLSWQWRLGNISLAEISLWWSLFVYAGWCLRRPRITKPKRTYARLVTLAVIVLFISCLPPLVRRPLEVTAVNVGQGDCFYLRTPSGRHLLIDGGGDTSYWQERGRNVGLERLVPYLQHRQVEQLDYVILTHPHEDHLFGLLAVLEHFEVGMIIDNGHERPSPTYERYLELIEQKNIPYHVARAGEVLDLGDDISLSILYPENLRLGLPSSYNNNSLLLRLQYGGVRLLFTGDLEAAVLYDLAHEPAVDLRSQWLKVPHHGSRGSLAEDFYAKVDPAWAVISVGANSFGHPHQEVLELFEQRKILWRTTVEGPVTFQVWWGVWGRFKWTPS